MSEFKIDFFELMFLAENCIPPKPISRSMFFDNLCYEHYNKMSNDERNRAFNWLSPKLDLENEACRLFFARFNPKNQFRVSCFYKGKAEVFDCFLLNDKYHTSKDTSVNEKYIKGAVLIERIQK